MHFLKLDALSKARGGVVGGVCTTNLKPPYEKGQTHKEVWAHVAQAQELLHFLGLDDPETSNFVYACPTDEDKATNRAQFVKVLELDAATSAAVSNAHNSPWLASLASRVQLVLAQTQDDDQVNQDQRLHVVVHIRRSDLSPCRKYNRYLPNAFYEQVLDEYLPRHCHGGMNATATSEAAMAVVDRKEILKHCRVTIHSQAESLESFEPFAEQRGYHLKLDTSLEEAWTDFITADILIPSESSFSYVPALLTNPRKTVVLTTGYGVKGIPAPASWIRLNDTFRHGQRTMDELYALKKRVC